MKKKKRVTPVKKTKVKKPVVKKVKKVVKPVKKPHAKKIVVKKKKIVARVVPRKKKLVVKKPEKKPQRLTVVDTTRKGPVPLIVEPYPKDYVGLPFLTLIQFRKQPMLVIIDNVDQQTIKAYVLDMCGPEAVDEEKIILTASEWFEKDRANFPVSIEFSRRGMTPDTSKIYRTFDVEFVSRVIGPAPEFPMDVVKSVKRRRRKSVPQGVEVTRGGNVVSLAEYFTT